MLHDEQAFAVAMLNREQLERLPETRLRREVLVPLFREMGFQDVHEYHGGALEQGKDIIMWKSDEYRERLNYAVVVKTKVNGRASGPGSAGEVVTQVQQCFGNPYRDPKTGEERKIERCFVVVGGPTPKEFINAVGGVLEHSGLSRDTTFFCAEDVWNLVRKYQPERTIFEPIQQLQTLLSEKFPGYGADIHLSEEKMTFNLKSITPEAIPPPPQSILFHISLEDDAGRKALKEYERFVRTGSAFTISKDQIKGIEVTDLLKEFYGLTEDTAVSFTFTPDPSPAVPWHFRRVCKDGYTATLRNVELRTVQAGTQEATLTNEHQKMPWILTVVTRKGNGSLAFNVSYKTNLAGANCRQALDWLRFQYGLASPGNLILEHADYGIEFPTSDDSGAGEAPSASLIESVERIVYIQARTTVAIPYPGRFSEQDIVDIDQLYTIVKAGRLLLSSMAAAFEKARIIANREKFDAPGSINIELHERAKRTCLGVEFDLGPSRVVGQGIVLSEDSLRRVRAEVERPTPGDSIELRLQPIESGQLDRIFPEWLSE